MLNKSIFNWRSKISEHELHSTYRIFFGTLVSHSRLKIINLLRNKEMNVSEIVKILNIRQTAVSHDLARLRQCGFVKAERRGQFVHYRLNQKTIKPLMKLIEEHMSEYCIHILHNMKRAGKDYGK